MGEKPHVLIVDDQPHLLLTLEYLVRTVEGVSVLTATNGVDAVEFAAENKPRLVLMDVVMPELDGYAACQMIRQRWGRYCGQIWLITTRGSHADLDQARQVGADRCITMPFDPDLVLQMVRETLHAPTSSAA